MNTRASCPNPECVAFGLEKSVMAFQLAGLGAPNERVGCLCGTLMTTTATLAAYNLRRNDRPPLSR